MRSKHSLLTLLAVTAVIACETPPTAIETNPDALVTAEARVGESVVLPMQVQADIVWVVDQTPDALAACAPRPGLAEGSGTGEATHLGRFQITRLDHCSIDLAAMPPLIDGGGTFEFAAADGSTLYGSYDFLFLPPEAGGFFELLVEGGTGRLMGASGRLEFLPERSGEVVCSDPLCLESAALSAAFGGSISLRRP